CVAVVTTVVLRKGSCEGNKKAPVPVRDGSATCAPAVPPSLELDAPSSSLRAMSADKPLLVTVETPVTPTRGSAPPSGHGSRIHSALILRRIFTNLRLSGANGLRLLVPITARFTCSVDPISLDGRCQRHSVPEQKRSAWSHILGEC